MPPQQTNLTSETEQDADLSIALMKDAVADALAARPARLAAASTQSVSGLLKRYWHAFQDRLAHRMLRTSLHDLNEKTLIDIGIPPGEIERIAAHRAIDELRDGTAHLWIVSRGVM
jgi:uncharacterized protein YjiS (DUF1127 family)